MARILTLGCIALLAGLAGPALAESPGEAPPRHAGQVIEMGVGVGLGVPVGGTSQDLQDSRFVALVPRWRIGIGPVLGREGAWYRGRFELGVEGQFLIQWEPRRGDAQGAAFTARYQLLEAGRFVPFAEVGLGMTHLNFDLDQQRDGFNFIVQAGGGARWLVNERWAGFASVKWHHISNAGTRRPNSGLDDVLLTLGVSYFPGW